MPSILFICLGNICRSPAAEAIFRNIVRSNNREPAVWNIDSAGIGSWHVGELPDRRMRVHANNRGIAMEHRCRQVKPSDFDDFDLIVAMDSSNISDLKDIAPSPEAQKKIVPMARYLKNYNDDHIPDPYYSGAEGFEHVLDLLEDACLNLYKSLE